MDDLVIWPFRKIVEIGTEAVENAGEDEAMLRSAQRLVRVAQHVLKDLESLCERRHDQYGSSFDEALADNDDITTHREKLSELAYELSDYVEVDTFDADKFDELKTESQKAGAKMRGNILKMRFPATGTTPLPTPSSPTPDSALLLGQSPSAASTMNPPQPAASVLSGSHSPDDDDGQLSNRHSHASEPSEELPPRPPSFNPWDKHSYPSSPDGLLIRDARISRPSADGFSSSPYMISPLSPSKPIGISGTLSATPSNTHQANGSETGVSLGDSPTLGIHSDVQPQSPPPDTNTPTWTPQDEEQIPRLFANFQSYTVQPGRSLDSQSPEVVPTTNAMAVNGDRGLGVGPHARPEVSDLPIPVNQDEVEGRKGSVATVPVTGGAIGPESAFLLKKGFCLGAQQVLEGTSGWKKIQKPKGIYSRMDVALCNGCVMELDFSRIENDLTKKDSGILKRSGIEHRLRFLQKSHIATRRVDDLLYGCVFCVHQGYTLDESDATAFIGEKALFDHLARHPRPLPEVPGITVLDQVEEVPPHLHNNFDIRFLRPVVSHPVRERAFDVSYLPTAIVKQQYRRRYGQSILHNKTPALQMEVGSKVTGITWLPPHMGEWCMGWHDGAYGAAPMNVLRLEAPSKQYIKINSASTATARAKWKFAPKEKDNMDWLKFDKKEEITNIGWCYYEFWCWSGRNSKGKWGIFPQAFVELTSSPDATDIQREDEDRVGNMHQDRERSMSFLSKFASRDRRSIGRPPSVSGSTSSHEQPPSAFPGLAMRSSRGQ